MTVFRTKSSLPLLCRCCAKAIHKYTTMACLRKEPGQYDHKTMDNRYIYVGDNWPKDIATCRMLSNHHVVAVKRGIDGRIASFSEWDGETYSDELFCSGSCAQAFGRMAARHGSLQTR